MRQIRIENNDKDKRDQVIKKRSDGSIGESTIAAPTVNCRSYLVQDIFYTSTFFVRVQSSHDAPHHLLSDDDSLVYMFFVVVVVVQFSLYFFAEHIFFRHLLSNKFSIIKRKNALCSSAIWTNIVR